MVLHLKYTHPPQTEGFEDRSVREVDFFFFFFDKLGYFINGLEIKGPNKTIPKDSNIIRWKKKLENKQHKNPNPYQKWKNQSSQQTRSQPKIKKRWDWSEKWLGDSQQNSSHSQTIKEDAWNGCPSPPDSSLCWELLQPKKRQTGSPSLTVPGGAQHHSLTVPGREVDFWINFKMKSL